MSSAAYVDERLPAAAPATMEKTQTHQAIVAGATPSPSSAEAEPFARTPSAGEGTNSTEGRALLEAQDPGALGGYQSIGSAAESCPRPSSTALRDPMLSMHADVLDDIERTLIANENRLRQMTRTEVDKDGLHRGHGLDEGHPDVARLAAIVAAFQRLNHDATLNLQRAMRAHPLGPWCKAQKGVGEKQAARLLAVLGDPYWNDLHDRPRTVSELWAYCGYRPGLKRTKGEKSNWSTVAKTRAWLISDSCIKQPASPYRAVYLARREHTALTHPEWTKGHSDADARRITTKAILRDLWIEARRIHLETTS